MDIRDDLIILQKALFDFSKRNPLVHARPKQLWFPEEDSGYSQPQKLFGKANFYRKEYGLETTLDVRIFIKWAPPAQSENEQRVFFTSPLFFHPCRIKRIQKIEREFTVDHNTEHLESNPVLRHYFKRFFDYDLSEIVENVELEMDKLTNFFNSGVSTEKMVRTEELDETDSWQLIAKRAIGNFNYKKSALGADFDQIIEHPGEAVERLLTGELKPDSEDLRDFQSISFLDQSQAGVIRKALNNDMVIQGPPGTGKSHTIVALIGAYLLENKKVLFVSEKRSALEVVNNRLNEKGLGKLTAYFNTDKAQKKEFYRSLKSTWETLNQPVEKSSGTTVSKSDEPAVLIFYPPKLNEYRPDLNGSLNELITILLETGNSFEELKVTGKTPAFKDWKNAMEFLLDFEKQILPVFESKSIAETAFIGLNSVVFSEPDAVLVLEKRLNDLTRILDRVLDLQSRYELDEGFDDFVKLALTASILNMVDKVQMDLLNTDSKKYKSFNNWAKKYQLLKTKLQHAELANEKWTKKPQLSEITEWMDLLTRSERQSKSVLGMLRRNPAKLKTAFKDFHSGIGNHTRIKLLESVKLEWRLKGELEEVKLKLKHNLNIGNPDHEIDLIFNLRNKLDAVSQNEYLRILEHVEPVELIKDLSSIHPDILKLNSQNRFLFTDTEIHSIRDYQKKLEGVRAVLPKINHWLPELKNFFKIPANIRSLIRSNSKTIGELSAAVAYQNLLNETRFEPEFKSLSGDELMTAVIETARETEQNYLRNSKRALENARLAQLNAENLLSKPGFKLKDPEKQKKKKYKAARRLLFHEMNKQQRHLSVKSFFETTKEHLLQIQPVWMMNPLTVSENLPCLADLFDVVIFDESSQIPLEDAIPTVYRAKQVVVVGDSKQMPPSAFFSSREDTKTILDQAEQSFPNEMLKWHYRSNHPDLIQFSNLEFYNGELICLPPKSIEQPIEVKYLENAVYDSGKNEVEAKEIAAYIKSIRAVNKSILIIAFSQEQEKEILRQMDKSGIPESDQITTRNLENAQGVEADIVIVSIGYGKNANGDFRLNFGPVNQQNGANRLNVLFTRAIEKMVVFTSVKSTDFGLSENRGVQLLKDYLSYAENRIASVTSVAEMSLAVKKVKAILDEGNCDYHFYPDKNGMGINAFIQHEKQRILLVDPCLETEDEQVDFKSVLFALKSQYKSVKIILSLDLWMNPERARSDIRNFFCGN